MDSWVFAAGVASVTGASIVQGAFAYGIERHRSARSRAEANDTSHRTARTAYRLILTELLRNRSTLSGCADDDQWWHATIAPLSVDWHAYRETVADHLDVPGLYRQLAISYGSLDILIAWHANLIEATADDDAPPALGSMKSTFEDQLEQIEVCIERLGPLTE